MQPSGLILCAHTETAEHPESGSSSVAVNGFLPLTVHALVLHTIAMRHDARSCTLAGVTLFRAQKPDTEALNAPATSPLPVTVLFNPLAFVSIDNPVSRRYADVLRVLADPFNRFHQALIDICIVDIFNFHQRNKDATGMTRYRIGNIVSAACTLEKKRPPEREYLVATIAKAIV
jgi:hypothetical protein